MVQGVEVDRPLNSHSFDAAPQHQQNGQPDATAVPRKPSLSLSAPTSGNKIHGVQQSTQSDHNQWAAPECPAAALTLDHLGSIERFFESDDANLKPVSPSLFNTADILYILLVHIYNIGVFKHVDSLCRKVQVTVASATIEIFIGYHPFSVQPPTWFWVLWEERRPGRGISEVSIGWIDTSWRTAHSVLHVGSISPLVAMPCLNQTRLRALWAASGSLTNGSDTVLAETPPLDPTTLPIRTHPVSRQKANRGAAPAARAPREPSRPAKKRKFGASGKKPDETPPPGGNGSGPGRPTERDAEPDNGRRWACHFFKLDPVRHMACLFHPQLCCRHVKSHLQRHHKLPFHCPTCFEIFKSGALRDAHIRARNCLRRDTPAYWDRYIPEDRMEELKDVTGGDWYAMWSVVFPDKEPPESPYTDASNQTGVAVGAVGDEVEPRFIEELSRTTLNPEQSREVTAALRRAFEVVSSPSENSHHPVVELGGEHEDDRQQRQILHFELIGDTSPDDLRSPSNQLSAPAGI
ncbi:hypothetical protein C8034_v009458 [Colletotrichum sidae]|uniref:C2H2-type domain-containing protein n=1 Tax=Colletotrichum sidae TaxID=1347389 RepID=A0A4R8TLV1_9PEZI|nr:hypothetical protein C8034_v009458 [Colletotrichum sidae]